MALDYVAYGLRIRSALPLPLPSWSGPQQGRPAVDVVFGSTPARLPPPAFRRRRWECVPGRCLLHLPGHARCLVADGRRIVLERWGGTEDEVEHWLLTTVLAALLLQRGIIPLHAGAVETYAGAALFLGASGAGKSTLVGALVGMGYTMMSDDITGVILEDEAPIALPGLPRLRLKQDSLDGLCLGKHQPAYDGKTRVPVEWFRVPSLRMAACYLLAPEPNGTAEQAGCTDGGAGIVRVSAAAALRWLCWHTYRRRRPGPFGQGKRHLQVALRVAAHVPMFDIQGLRKRLPPVARAARIAAHLASLPDGRWTD